MSGVECVVDCKAWLGEGPVWSPRESCLYWTDVPSRSVHRWSPATGERIPIADGPKWGRIESPGLGVVVDEARLAAFHEAYRRDGEFVSYHRTEPTG